MLLVILLAACHTPSPGVDAPRSATPATPAAELTWSWPETPVGPMNVVVRVPAHGPLDRFPVLVALHGRGEARKGPAAGARGWVDDYHLTHAIERLSAPPLTPDDLLGLVTPQRLATLNAALTADPYRGLIVVCPYTPDIFREDTPSDTTEAYASFILGTVLPRVHADTPARAEPGATGIDGVSLGGRVAMLVGLSHPEAFGAVGVLQPAFGTEDAPALADLAAAARTRSPRLALGLVTSTEDYFKKATYAIDAELTARAVPHTLLELPGPHDYAFNQGPGAFEMLLFHDRVLHARPPVAPIR